MNINIDTIAIQDAVVQAIIDSAIGEQIRKVIGEILTNKENSWDNQTILQKGIRSEMWRIISNILREEIESRKDEIRKLIAPQLTDEIILSMSSAALDVMLGNLSKS